MSGEMERRVIEGTITDGGPMPSPVTEPEPQSEPDPATTLLFRYLRDNHFPLVQAIEDIENSDNVAEYKAAVRALKAEVKRIPLR